MAGTSDVIYRPIRTHYRLLPGKSMPESSWPKTSYKLLRFCCACVWVCIQSWPEFYNLRRDKGTIFKSVKSNRLLWLLFRDCCAHLEETSWGPGVTHNFLGGSLSHLLIIVKSKLPGGSLKTVEPVASNQMHITTLIPIHSQLPYCVPFIKANDSSEKVPRADQPSVNNGASKTGSCFPLKALALQCTHVIYLGYIFYTNIRVFN